MGFDDDLLEGLDEFDDEPFPSDDFEDFPATDDDDSGPSNTFLIIGGLIVASFLILLVVALLLLSGGGASEDEETATAVAETNVAVRIAFESTGTRAAVIDATNTSEAVATGTQQAAETEAAALANATLVEEQLNVTRTAIITNATATEAQRETEVFSEFAGQTETAVALTPTSTPLPTIRVPVQDSSGNPLPEGSVIEIYEDDGDGVFNPGPSTGPTPTAIPRESGPPTVAPTATNTAAPIPTLSPTPDSGAGAEATDDSQTLPPTPTEEGGAAGFNAGVDGGNDASFARVEANNDNSGLAQEDGTPTAEPTQTGGDRLVARVEANPDGSFTISGLPPGNYFFVINGEPVAVEVPNEPIESQILVNGQAVPVFIVPNIEFSTVTPTPSSTPTASPTLNEQESGVIETATADQATRSAQETLVATLNPTLQTLQPTMDATLIEAVNQTRTAEGPSVGDGSAVDGATITASPSELPNTGFFDDLGSNTSSGDLTFLALLGLGLIAAIIMVRRLRSAM